ncbi:MAG: hypothetical protein R2764_05180 [Bacteroidales bacterium]
MLIHSQEVSQTEEVTVVAPYQPKVSEAFKINISPKIPDEEIEKPEFKYSIKSKTLETKPELDLIRPANIASESVSKLYKNYVKVGMGNYWTPFLELYANKLRSKKSAFGVYMKHLSSSGTIKDYAYPGNSNTEVKGYGKKFIKDHTLSAEVLYKRTGVHYYGYKPDDFPELSLEKKDIKQCFNLLGVSTDFSSNYTKARFLNHSIGLSYFYLRDNYKTNEQNLKVDAGVDKSFSFFDFSEQEKLGLDVNVDYYFNSDTITNHNSGIIKINPYYKLGFAQYNFKVGLDASIESDSVTKAHFYPIVHIEVHVVKDALLTYAGINGELYRNSYRALSDENPFIITNIDKRFSNNKLSQYGGIRGRINNYFNYNLSFVNSTIENMPFFVNDTISALGPGLDNQFTLVYDKVKYSRVIAEFGFHWKNKFNAMLRGKYNSYFMDNEDKPWHKPGLEISFNADYNLQDKILIRAEFFTTSKMYAKIYDEVQSGSTSSTIESQAEINGKFDLSLGAEYRYSEQLSGFITLNNILGQRYFNWYNYPSYKFNLMLGVTYSF